MLERSEMMELDFGYSFSLFFSSPSLHGIVAKVKERHKTRKGMKVEVSNKRNSLIPFFSPPFFFSLKIE